MARNQKLTAVIEGRTVKAVRQTDEVMHIDFTDGSTMEIKLQGATACVMVRDGNKVLEYAD